MRRQRRATMERCTAGQTEAAGVRDIFRAGAAGQGDSVGLVVVMVDGFLIGDGFVARYLDVRPPGGIDVVLPNAG